LARQDALKLARPDRSPFGRASLFADLPVASGCDGSIAAARL